MINGKPKNHRHCLIQEGCWLLVIISIIIQAWDYTQNSYYSFPHSRHFQGKTLHFSINLNIWYVPISWNQSTPIYALSPSKFSIQFAYHPWWWRSGLFLLVWTLDLFTSFSEKSKTCSAPRLALECRGRVLLRAASAKIRAKEPALTARRYANRRL